LVHIRTKAADLDERGVKSNAAAFGKATNLAELCAHHRNSVPLSEGHMKILPFCGLDCHEYWLFHYFNGVGSPPVVIRLRKVAIESLRNVIADGTSVVRVIPEKYAVPCFGG
jgi:hypothetical protein